MNSKILYVQYVTLSVFVITLTSCGPSKTIFETADCIGKGEIESQTFGSLNPSIFPIGFKDGDTILNIAQGDFNYSPAPLSFNVGGQITYGISNNWNLGGTAEVFLLGYGLGLTNKINLKKLKNWSLSYYNKSYFSQGIIPSPVRAQVMRFNLGTTNYILLTKNLKEKYKLTFSPHVAFSYIGNARKQKYWLDNAGNIYPNPVLPDQDQAETGFFNIQNPNLSMISYGMGISLKLLKFKSNPCIEFGFRKFHNNSSVTSISIDNLSIPAIYFGLSQNF